MHAHPCMLNTLASVSVYLETQTQGALPHAAIVLEHVTCHAAHTTQRRLRRAKTQQELRCACEMEPHLLGRCPEHSDWRHQPVGPKHVLQRDVLCISHREQHSTGDTVTENGEAAKKHHRCVWICAAITPDIPVAHTGSLGNMRNMGRSMGMPSLEAKALISATYSRRFCMGYGGGGGSVGAPTNTPHGCWLAC